MTNPTNDYTLTWTARQNLIRDWSNWSIFHGVPVQAAYDLGLGLSPTGILLRITAGVDRSCNVVQLTMEEANRLVRSWVRNQRHQFERWVSRAGKDASLLCRMIEKSTMTGGRHD
jgi:hypothetical protein